LGTITEGVIANLEFTYIAKIFNIVSGQVYLSGAITELEGIGIVTVIIEGLYHSPHLAWNGTSFGLTFCGKTVPGQPNNVWFVSLDDTGNPGELREVTTQADTQYKKLSKIAWDGEQYGIAWQDRRNGNLEIFFRKLTSDGQAISEELSVSESPEGVAALGQLIFNGSEFGLAYSSTQESPNSYQTYLARISMNGSEVLEHHRVSIYEAQADTPGLTY